MYNYFVDFNLPSRKQRGPDALHTERGRVQDFDTHYLALIQVSSSSSYDMHVSSSSYGTHPHMTNMYPPPHMTRTTWPLFIHLPHSHMTCMYPPPHMTRTTWPLFIIFFILVQSSYDMHVSSSSYDTHYHTLIQWRYVGLMLSEFVGASTAEFVGASTTSKRACPAILVSSVEGAWEDKEMAGVRDEYWPTWGHAGNEF